MADLRYSTDGPSPLSATGYDESRLPDFMTEFVSEEDIAAFAKALAAPWPSPSTDDLLNQSTPVQEAKTSTDIARSAESQQPLFITAQHDWAPVHERIKPSRRRKDKLKQKQKRKRKVPRRSKDETREGYLYTILKWPLLGIVCAWVAGLGVSYLLTRLYIFLYEHFIAWRGKRAKLRKQLEATTNYTDWVVAATELDRWAGSEEWKKQPEYAYYDHSTVQRVLDQMKRTRRQAEAEESRNGTGATEEGRNEKETTDRATVRPIEELKGLIEACVKSNFAGVENPRLYSQTYYGTKDLVQDFTDESKNASPFPFPFLFPVPLPRHALQV